MSTEQIMRFAYICSVVHGDQIVIAIYDYLFNYEHHELIIQWEYIWLYDRYIELTSRN